MGEVNSEPPPLDDDSAKQSSPGSTADEMSNIEKSINAMTDDLRVLRQEFEARIRHDDSKERAFQRLYNELDDLKRNANDEALRPMYLDIILLLDRIHKLEDETIEHPNANPDVHDILDTLSQEVLEVLARRGVELIQPSSKIFEKSNQRVVGTVQSSDQKKENHIDRVTRSGFVCNGLLIRPTDVIIYVYQKEERSEDNASA
jgi:molecular chaperone GrpE (heat shock protein)